MASHPCIQPHLEGQGFVVVIVRGIRYLCMFYIVIQSKLTLSINFKVDILKYNKFTYHSSL